jgi:hypothetical protein
MDGDQLNLKTGIEGVRAARRKRAGPRMADKFVSATIERKHRSGTCGAATSPRAPQPRCGY